MNISVQLLGRSQIVVDGGVVPLSAARESSLFAYLALHPNTAVSRETLIEALWPNAIDYSPPKLRQGIWKLRRILAPAAPALKIDKTSAGAIVLRCDAHVIDVVKFTDLVTTKGNVETSLRAAVELYEGDLLPGMTDDWIERPRHELRVRFLQATKQLAEQLLARGAAPEALEYARRAVLVDPADEEATYSFMRAAAECMDVAGGLAQYHILSRALEDDGSPPPSAHLRTLANELRARRTDSAGISSRSTRRTTTTAILSPDSIPLVDRNSELGHLMNLLEESLNGPSHAIVITGPAGIGKTRLVDAVASRARQFGVPIYKGECADVPNPPLWQPVVEALRKPLTAAIAGGQSPIFDILQDGGTSARRRRSIGGPASSSPIHSSLVIEALLSLLPTRHGSPVLLILENIQRADEATIVWVDALIRRVNEYQVYVLLTIRTDERNDTEKRVMSLANSGCEPMRLAPLTSGGVRRLIASVLRTEYPPRALCDAMWVSIGGNPLSILNAITVLQTQGLLQLSPSGWIIDKEVPAVLAEHASSHIKSMVQHHLRLLTNSARDVLAAAAVMGGDVAIDHLQRLAVLPRRRFFAELDGLFRQGLLVSAERSAIRFAHEEIRSAVLDELTPPRQHALHTEVAKLLTSLGEAARPEHLFWHYDTAGDPSGASKAATAAGDRCYEIGEYLAAITWYERALETLSRGAHSGEVMRRLEIELKLEAALNHHGDRQHQLELLDTVVRAANDGGFHPYLCEALIRKSLCLARMHRRTDAVQAAERALVIARHWSDLRHQAHAHRALGLAFDASDDHVSVRYLKSAAQLFRRVGNTTDESITLSELTTVYDRLGEQTRALRSISRAIFLLPETDPTNALLKGRQGTFLMSQGRLSEALEVLSQALQLSERAGQRVWAARTLRVLCDVHLLAGRFRDALSTAGKAWRIASQAKDVRLIISTLNSLLTIYGRLGLTRRAEDTFDRIKRFAANDPESQYHALAEGSLSDAYLESGRWGKAHDWATRSIETASARSKKGGYIIAGAQHVRGQALIELGSPILAVEPLMNALPYYRAAGDLVREAHVTALLGFAAIDTDDRVSAAAYLHESVRLTRRIERACDLRHILYLHGVLWERLGSPRKAARAYRAAHARLLQIAFGIAPRGRTGDHQPPLRLHFLDLPFNRRIINAANRGARPVAQVATSIFGVDATGSNGTNHRAGRINARRQAILRTLETSPTRPTRRDLAASLGVTPRTITSDLAALRHASHKAR